MGNGTSDTARSNAHTIDWDGNAWFAGDVESGSGKLATESYVDSKMVNAGTNSDWNENDENSPAYIKNRTHWAEKEKKLVYPANSSESFEHDGTIFNTILYEYWGEEKYLVIANGVEYPNRHLYIEFDEDGAGVITDAYFYPEIPNILLQYDHVGFSYDDINGYGLWVEKIYDTENNNVEVYFGTNELIYHSLDKNYLPDDVVYTKDLDNKAKRHYIVAGQKTGATLGS
jgi:hypothetical protein